MRFLLLSLLCMMYGTYVHGQQEEEVGASVAENISNSTIDNATEPTVQPADVENPVSQEPVVSQEDQAPAEKVEVPQLPEPPVTSSPEHIPVDEKRAITEQIEDINVEQDAGFDTVGLDEPEGNWLIKRIWWEKAEVRYEKIKTLLDQILDLRISFFTQRNEVESKILDPFYFQQSLTHGQLDEIVAFLLDTLRHEREKDKGLQPQEQDLYETLLAEQRMLEQLKLDIEGIQKLDIQLDDDLNQLIEQVNLCRTYEKQAWSAFKDIAKVLDHNKARALYYSMDTYLGNIRSIDGYIQNTFTQHFNGIIAQIKSNVEHITQTLTTLKEKGIDLKQQVIKLEEEERAQQCKLPSTETEQKMVDEEDEEPQGWLASIWTSMGSFFSGIWDLIAFWK